MTTVSTEMILSAPMIDALLLFDEQGGAYPTEINGNTRKALLARWLIRYTYDKNRMPLCITGIGRFWVSAYRQGLRDGEGDE